MTAVLTGCLRRSAIQSRFYAGRTARSLDVAHDGLAAFVNVNVLDGHFLLTLAAMSIESFEQR